MITFDLDFGEIVAFTQSASASVVILRLADTSNDHVIERLRAVLPACVTDLRKGAMVVIEESRHRLRYLPVGRTVQ